VKNTSSPLSNHIRLSSLDGLRGLAILFVFLDHIKPTFIIRSFPLLDQLGIFSSGIFGVSILFILSGFLMTVLYPNPSSSITFIQKRYTRIFPLFLTMCVTVFIITILPHQTWSTSLVLLCVFTLLTHLLWIGIKKIHKSIFSRILFILFLCIQVTVGVFYAFWVMRYPPSILVSLFPPYGKPLITGLVNGTLTFPLGNYIPMLDGVYWSLAAEIVFYILYPIIIVPIVNFLIPTKRCIKIIFLVSLMPLLVSVDILSHHIFVLSALQFSLFFYFATGIALGYLYRTKNEILSDLWKYFRDTYSILPIVLLVSLLIVQRFFDSTLPNEFSPWIRILLAIPITIIVATILDTSSGIARILNSRIFVFLGTISYSIYLSHSLIINFVQKIIIPTNTTQNIALIFFAFLVVVVVAWVLYQLLEKPYFTGNQQFREKTTSLKSQAQTKGLATLIGLLLVGILSIGLAFHSTYNFSSSIYNHSIVSLIIPKTRNVSDISMKKYQSVEFKIKALDNNFGIFSVAITHVSPKTKYDNPPLLNYSIREQGQNTILFSSDYVFDEFKGENFPFGFPTIVKSQGKTYLINFTLTKKATTEDLLINPTTVQSVYQIDKRQLMNHPTILVTLLKNKVITIITNHKAVNAFLLQIPFITIVLWLVLQLLLKIHNNKSC
jgi:peptidoglycan/LPS O-acetylase OafA/YrhL